MRGERRFGGKDPVEFIQKNGRRCMIAPRNVVCLSETADGTYIAIESGGGYNVNLTIDEVVSALESRPESLGIPVPIESKHAPTFAEAVIAVAALAFVAFLVLQFTSCARKGAREPAHGSFSSKPQRRAAINAADWSTDSPAVFELAAGHFWGGAK